MENDKLVGFLKYRDNSYFNENDYFLILTNLNAFFITKVHPWNGYYFSNESLKYKMTTVLTVNCNEIKGLTIRYEDTTLKGVISKFIEPNGIGVVWNQGENYRKFGFPNYWNLMSNLTLILK